MNKEHILQEIRRTAAKNNGKPLGKDRFFHETGIKIYDWFGKYWARWSDAVREAGFSPNKLTVAYSEGFLFEKYIDLIRELGRLPVEGDLRLKSRSDPEFPSSDTFFYRRFGSKPAFITHLIRYCQDQNKYNDISQLCKEYSSQSKDESELMNFDEEQIGFVYLVKSGRFYKIGRTNAVGRREYELAVQLPEKAATVHVIRTDDPVGIESYWHKRFESRHKNGEWFELSAKDLAAFKRRKFM